MNTAIAMTYAEEIVKVKILTCLPVMVVIYSLRKVGGKYPETNGNGEAKG